MPPPSPPSPPPSVASGVVRGSPSVPSPSPPPPPPPEVFGQVGALNTPPAPPPPPTVTAAAAPVGAARPTVGLRCTLPADIDQHRRSGAQGEVTADLGGVAA